MKAEVRMNTTKGETNINSQEIYSCLLAKRIIIAMEGFRNRFLVVVPFVVVGS